MTVFTATLARLIALSACAALFVMEHVRLALRARRGEHGAQRLATALLLPGAGAVFAWRGGARVAPVAYFLLALGYIALRYAR